MQAAIKKFLFYPYLIFLLSFLIYTVVIFEDFHIAKEEVEHSGETPSSLVDLGIKDIDIGKF